MSHHGYSPPFSYGAIASGQSDSTIDLFIETLTGAAFEMTVSPLDTIANIKSKIQRVEGIPASQQHLLYNLQELEDWRCLRDCAVHNGATLKLVLSMRGGPITTRRMIPAVDERAWRELQDIVDSSRDEVSERLSAGGQLTVLVYRKDDQLNVLQIIENTGGTYSPLSDSINGSSLRSLFSEDGADDTSWRLRENTVTMIKMQELRRRLDSLSRQKKPKTKLGDATVPVDSLSEDCVGASVAPSEKTSATSSAFPKPAAPTSDTQPLLLFGGKRPRSLRVNEKRESKHSVSLPPLTVPLKAEPNRAAGSASGSMPNPFGSSSSNVRGAQALDLNRHRSEAMTRRRHPNMAPPFRGQPHGLTRRQQFLLDPPVPRPFPRPVPSRRHLLVPLPYFESGALGERRVENNPNLTDRRSHASDPWNLPWPVLERMEMEAEGGKLNEDMFPTSRLKCPSLWTVPKWKNRLDDRLSKAASSMLRETEGPERLSRQSSRERASQQETSSEEEEEETQTAPANPDGADDVWNYLAGIVKSTASSAAAAGASSATPKPSSPPASTSCAGSGTAAPSLTSSPRSKVAASSQIVVGLQSPRPRVLSGPTSGVPQRRLCLVLSRSSSYSSPCQHHLCTGSTGTTAGSDLSRHSGVLVVLPNGTNSLGCSGCLSDEEDPLPPRLHSAPSSSGTSAPRGLLADTRQSPLQSKCGGVSPPAAHASRHVTCSRPERRYSISGPKLAAMVPRDAGDEPLTLRLADSCLYRRRSLQAASAVAPASTDGTASTPPPRPSLSIKVAGGGRRESPAAENDGAPPVAAEPTLGLLESVVQLCVSSSPNHLETAADGEAECDRSEVRKELVTEEPLKIRKSHIRCGQCRRKLTISNQYVCRCEKHFCSVHRYSEAHECTFDYKAEGRRRLLEENPLVKSRKVQRM